MSEGQTKKILFKSKTVSSILEPYHLLHVDLFGPVNVMSIAKKKYALVIVDEFTRYTWVYFLHTKSETASILIDHVKQLDKLVKDYVKIIRSDNGTEFKNLIMEEFCKDHGIKQVFSAPGTPQQNGVVERNMIFAFGGGFKGGDKADKGYIPYFEFLARNGFVVVSTDYRTTLKLSLIHIFCIFAPRKSRIIIV